MSVLATSSRLVGRFAAKPTSALRYMSSNQESYSERQAKTGRPLSPHVTIYKFPIAALSSITNRATGVGLYGGIAGVGALALMGGDVSSCMSTIGAIGGVGFLAKFCVSFPFIYHYAAGLRHLMWDKNPESLDKISDVEKSSYIVMGASVASSIALSIL